MTEQTRDSWQRIADQNRMWLRKKDVSVETRARAWAYLGMSLYHLGQHDEARTALTTALVGWPCAFVQEMLARNEMKAGNVAASLDHYLFAVEMEPWNYSEAADVAAKQGYQLVKSPRGRYALRPMTLGVRS